MNKIAFGIVLAAGLAAPALAQGTSTFQFEIVADSTGPLALTQTAPTIGFWLRARVSQSSGSNHGIGRFSPPPVGSSIPTSQIVVNDPGRVASSTLARGLTGTNQATLPLPFRSGAPTGAANNQQLGNTAGQAVYPGVAGNNRGAIDQAGARMYSFDAYVGASRSGDGSGDNPWLLAADGGIATTNQGGVLADVGAGTFSGWQNLIRFEYRPGSSATQRDITITAAGFAQAIFALSDVSDTWAARLGAGQIVTDDITFNYGIPTPGAAAVMGMGLIAAGRRRR